MTDEERPHSPDFGEPSLLSLNDAEVLAVGDPTILVESYEAAFVSAGKLGKGARPVFMVTLTGKRNSRDETMTASLMFDPKDGWEFVGFLIDRYEWLAANPPTTEEGR